MGECGGAWRNLEILPSSYWESQIPPCPLRGMSSWNHCTRVSLVTLAPRWQALDMRRGRFLCFQLAVFSSTICFYAYQLGSLPLVSRWFWRTEVFVPWTCHKLGLVLKSPTLSCIGLEIQHPSSSSPQTQAGLGTEAVVFRRVPYSTLPEACGSPPEM